MKIAAEVCMLKAKERISFWCSNHLNCSGSSHAFEHLSHVMIHVNIYIPVQELCIKFMEIEINWFISRPWQEMWSYIITLQVFCVFRFLPLLIAIFRIDNIFFLQTKSNTLYTTFKAYYMLPIYSDGTNPAVKYSYKSSISGSRWIEAENWG